MIQGFQARFAPHQPINYYRTVFLSDIHLGHKDCDAAALLDFLKSIHCDHLYLIGDIIDGTSLKDCWLWNEECNRVIDEILYKADHGTKITYLPGNHDKEMLEIGLFNRLISKHKLNIKIQEKVFHTLANGSQFLIMHGDQFDKKILHPKVKTTLQKLPEYTKTLWNKLYKNQTPPTDFQSKKEKKFSLSTLLQNHSKLAIPLLAKFESLIHQAIHDYDVDGIICGHTHVPVIKAVNEGLYANAGSWIRQKHTALVESKDGKISMVDCKPSFPKTPLLSLSDNIVFPEIKITSDAYAYRPLTRKVVSLIRRTWAPQLPLHSAIQNKLFTEKKLQFMFYKRMVAVKNSFSTL